ncbi:MAG TPA: hypothetical protein VF665_03355, partial [Longimicrobium sp.]
RLDEAKAQYRSGKRGEAPAPAGPRLSPLSPAPSARVTADGEPAPATLTLSAAAADRPDILSPVQRTDIVPAADRPDSSPAANRAEGGSMVVQEVVITRMSTETDAGDLVDGDAAK